MSFLVDLDVQVPCARANNFCYHVLYTAGVDRMIVCILRKTMHTYAFVMTKLIYIHTTHTTHVLRNTCNI